MISDRRHGQSCDSVQALAGIEATVGAHGIRFHHELEAIRALLPADWFAPPASVSIGAVPQAKLCQIDQLLRTELAKYPTGLLRVELEHLLLLGELSFAGAGYGGTYFAKTVMLAAGDSSLWVPDSYLAETFHHEFSSVLLQSHAFPAEAWRRTLPQGFRYPDDWEKELQRVKEHANQVVTDRGLGEGFLSDYSRTSFENDINSYAGMLFSQPKRLRDLMKQHSVIKQKAELLAAYYVSIDAGMMPLLAEYLGFAPKTR